MTGVQTCALPIFYTFSFDKKTGSLNKLNAQKVNGGRPCYISVDKDETFAVTANYNGGNVTLFDIENSGLLTPASKNFMFHGKSINPRRQKQPYLHSSVFSPDQNILLAADLGSDNIYLFSHDRRNHTLLLQDSVLLEAGSGPRHIAFSPSGNMAYVICELSGKVAVLKKEKDSFIPVQYIIADEHNGQSSADIHITNDGRYLYASVRDTPEDGIAIFGISQETGLLTHIGYQPTARHPRNFVLTPDNKYLLVASRDDNKIEVYTIKENGLLKNTGNFVNVKKPVCLKWIME